MERLNNIMRTAQQRPRGGADRRPMQQQPSRESQQPVQERNPLYGQPPRAGTASGSPRSYQTRPGLPLPSNGFQSGESTPPARPQRTSYGSQRSVHHSPTIRYSENPQGDFYEEMEEPGVVSGDVSAEWNDADDTGGMRYGDWEGEPETRHPSYVEENSYLPSSPYASYNSGPARRATRELSPTAQRLSQLHATKGSTVTRELSNTLPETSSPVRTTRETRLPVPAPSSQLTSISRSQQPVTRPLMPQQITQLQNGAQRRSLRPVPPETPHNPTADYTPVLVNNPVCSICKGAGFLRSDVSFGHPQFGKAVACQCKEQERKRKRRQQLNEISNMRAFSEKRFDNFTISMASLQEPYRVAQDFAHTPDGWLFLVGPNGCGKTHLAAAIANTCLEAGAVVLFATVPDLLDHLRAAFAPDAREVYDQLFARMREAELLVLDDLGAQQSSPWANEKLFQLLNYRYNLGIPTVINANPKGLQTTDERIRSRLSDTGLVVTLNLDRVRDHRPMNSRASKAF